MASQPVPRPGPDSRTNIADLHEEVERFARAPRDPRGRAGRVRPAKRRTLRPATGLLHDQLDPRDQRHPLDGLARRGRGAQVQAGHPLRRRRGRRHHPAARVAT